MNDDSDSKTPFRNIEARIVANPYRTARATAEEKANQAYIKKHLKNLASGDFGKHFYELGDDGFDSMLTWCTTARRWLPPKSDEESCPHCNPSVSAQCKPTSDA